MKRQVGLILRFLSGGGIGVLVYYLSLYVLTEFLQVWYLLSAVIGFLLNNTINFLIQKFWTFKNKDAAAIKKQFTLYLVMGAALLVTNTGLLYLLVEGLGWHYLIAQLMLTIFLTTISFLVTRKIFKR